MVAGERGSVVRISLDCRLARLPRVEERTRTDRLPQTDEATDRWRPDRARALVEAGRGLRCDPDGDRVGSVRHDRITDQRPLWEAVHAALVRCQDVENPV
jgi:hypothetical protein